MDACQVFLQGMLAPVSLIGDLFGVLVNKVYTGCWAGFALPGCHSPLGDRVCSPVVGVQAPRSSSNLWCEVGGTGVFPLQEESLPVIWFVHPQKSLLLLFLQHWGATSTAGVLDISSEFSPTSTWVPVKFTKSMLWAPCPLWAQWEWGVGRPTVLLCWVDSGAPVMDLPSILHTPLSRDLGHTPRTLVCLSTNKLILFPRSAC